MTIEEFNAASDLDELASLLNENPIPGQPRVTTDMVRATFTHDAPVDQWFHHQLISTRVLGTRDRSGRLVAAAAYGDARRGVRDLIWLHAANDVVGAIETLIDEVFAAWTGPARAFWYSSTIFAGLEGLPRTHRTATHRALLARGFVGKDLWSYQTRSIDPTAACELGFVEKRVLHDDTGTAVAEYEVGIPYPDLGALWWITTYPPYRGRGFAGRALDAALGSLATHGARSVMLFVDDDEPAGERDRRPALALYASRGFREVDRLWSYAKGDLPPDERTTD